jgi:hypothetical protein
LLRSVCRQRPMVERTRASSAGSRSAWRH